MSSARTVRIHRFGGPDVLQFDETDVPAPQGEDIVVRVHAFSINPVDYKIRLGEFPPVQQGQLPFALGRDASGVVESVGPDATSVQPGDAVFLMPGFDRGTYTERMLVRPGEWAQRPFTLDHRQAAAVPLAALTAWQGLFDHGGLRSGQRVLIHGGAGGVGHFAVQFAKAAGAHVFATASGDDLDFVRALGADEAIDYKSQRFEDIAADIDVVLDLIAGETQTRSWSVLKPGGSMISTLQKPDESRARERDATAANYMAHPDAAQLEAIGRLIVAGKVKPHVAAVFPFAMIQDAQRRLEEGHVRGKIVVEVFAFD